mgnify:CR=1 FL=1
MVRACHVPEHLVVLVLLPAETDDKIVLLLHFFVLVVGAIAMRRQDNSLLEPSCHVSQILLVLKNHCSSQRKVDDRVALDDSEVFHQPLVVCAIDPDRGDLYFFLHLLYGFQDDIQSVLARLGLAVFVISNESEHVLVLEE